MASGQPLEAAQWFEKAAAVDPKRAAYWLDAGLAYKDGGNSEKAMATLERAIVLDPALEEAYEKLAEVYGKAGRTEDVQRTLERYRNVLASVSLNAKAAR